MSVNCGDTVVVSTDCYFPYCPEYAIVDHVCQVVNTYVRDDQVWLELNVKTISNKNVIVPESKVIKIESNQ